MPSVRTNVTVTEEQKQWVEDNHKSMSSLLQEKIEEEGGPAAN
ncbi:MAG: hypothetical protein ABEI97_04590 [Candidatus Nanohaloarchaea archaeon]